MGLTWLSGQEHHCSCALIRKILKDVNTMILTFSIQSYFVYFCIFSHFLKKV